MTVLARFRSRKLMPRVASYGAQYEDATAASVPAVQLRALNESWSQSLAQSPWARALRAEFDLPPQFESWTAFEAAVPVMGKAQLRPAIAAGSGEGAEAGIVWRATGGSTAEPFRFPVSAEEQASAALDIWLGRRWLGVDPHDRLFLLWGHAHLLGSGAQGRLNRIKRQLSDRLLGYTRCSAYDLTDVDLNRACDRLLTSRARYVVGYSTALDRFARANADRAPEIARLGLKAVIATAEGFPRSDSRNVIAACFGASVVMEFGAVETGPLAYERPEGGYDVFWARHRLERRGGEGPGADELLVTSLYPRALPLMRYALGDLVELASETPTEPPILQMARIVGRCNELLVLPDGATVHSEAFTHSMRDIPGVRAFQVVCPSGSQPWIRYEASAPLSAGSMSEIQRRLGIINQSLINTRFEPVERIVLSVAGKHRMVVDS